MNLFLIFLVSFSVANAVNPKTAVFAEAMPTGHVRDKRVLSYKPTDKDVKLIETNLDVYLKKHHPKIYSKYKNYYRQYSGIKIVGVGTKIKARFMCRVDGDQWKKGPIITLDGGDCYFDFLFEIEKQEISDFHVNGEA